MFYDGDADPAALKGKTVAVIGYGSQGHAHALNLKDSGVNVVVGLQRESRRWNKVTDDGLKIMQVREASEAGDVVMILVPDEIQAALYQDEIAPAMVQGKTLAFAHGFNIHFGRIEPPEHVDVFMVAPKGPGHLVRRMYKKGVGVPGLLAIHRDFTGQCRNVGLAYCARHWGHQGRRHRNHICGRDGNRPVRRASSPVWWRYRLDYRGFRDTCGGGLPAGDRVLRVSPRTQTYRGSHL